MRLANFDQENDIPMEFRHITLLTPGFTTVLNGHSSKRDDCSISSSNEETCNQRYLEMMKQQILKFLRDERGLTTVEYAVAGALITVAVVAAFRALGLKVAGVITTITGALP